MSDTRTSFNYDPFRQGYDTNSWRTITGAPEIINGSRLAVDTGDGDTGSIIHYIDFLKGEIIFDVNIPVAPGLDAARFFGAAAVSSNLSIGFSIGSTLNCKTVNGSNSTESDDILWDSSWTGENVLFMIRWEAGGAKFFVNGVQVYAVSDASVPYGPLSLYLYDSSGSPMTFGDIIVRNAQSMIVNPKTSDTEYYTSGLLVGQSITVTDVFTSDIDIETTTSSSSSTESTSSSSESTSSSSSSSESTSSSSSSSSESTSSSSESTSSSSFSESTSSSSESSSSSSSSTSESTSSSSQSSSTTST